MYLGHRTIDDKFIKSFSNLKVTDEFIENLYDYYFNGLHPGGFFESMLCNDMYTAMSRCHVMNSLNSIQGVCKWLVNFAPPESFNTINNIVYWISLTTEQRCHILQKRNLMLTPWEILGGTN